MTNYRINPLKNNLHTYEPMTLNMYRENKIKQLELATENVRRQEGKNSQMLENAQAKVTALQSDIALYTAELIKRPFNVGAIKKANREENNLVDSSLYGF